MAMKSYTPFQLTGRYAERNKWENLNGPGDSRPTGLQVVEDENLVGALKDKVILITGVSSGMGPETVRALAATGATIFGTARDLPKARAALGDDLLIKQGRRVHLLAMDQTDLSSVRACGTEFARRTPQPGRLHVLINNAGIMKTPEQRVFNNGNGDADGDGIGRVKLELQFVTNHLSHFLLFYLLRDHLLAGSTPAFHSRVVNVSSSGHRYGPVRFDDLAFEGGGGYDGWAAYGQSKTANIYMATQIERLYGARGLHGYSVSPGSFVSPNLQKYCQDEMEGVKESERMMKYLCSVQQGCATSVYGAVSRDLEGKGGLYLEGASVAGPVPRDGDVVEYGYGEWAFDEEKERKLWELSKTMVGVEE
ncbi:short-chain dehydrogenase [Xylariomycetidae sp. FL2044]|nr:short-chain dehydrogenase [Xylariomycetidae sp. FL2044]